MDTVKIRKEINAYIQKADNRFLNLVYGMIKADQSSRSIGYKPDGNPILKEELITRAKRSEKDIQKNQVKQIDQIRNELKNW
jgi:hypothetical protein